jgi:hypothetical protein
MIPSNLRHNNDQQLNSLGFEFKFVYLLAESEGKAGLLGGLSEDLILDGQVTDGEGVLGNKALEGAGSIADGELGSVGLVRRRRSRVVLGVQEASNRRALAGRNPEVG